ncbi:MAG: imidazolonepropionase [Myxococcales bacterium]|nr:imidazolonepropionase [Myxococcales bacterium]
MSAPTELLISNIGRLATMNGEGAVLRDVAVLCAEGRVVYVGPESGVPAASRVRERLDAGGRAVLPGLVDCHTHLVFAGDRRDEFALRCSGATYAEIHAQGGGIVRTMRLTRDASEEELLLTAIRRAAAMVMRGVTTLEIKSGYGLSLDAELKQLRVARAIEDHLPVRVITTFLGGHSVPPEYRDRRADYIDLVCNEMIPRVVEEGLATFCDVFCEERVFSIAESERILLVAKAHGLGVKLHADQLTRTGAARLGVALGAVSVDHLEQITAEDVALLGAHPETVAVLLPASVLFLRSQTYPPGRALVDAGATVAISTDLNPGSSMCDDLPLMTTLGCTSLGLTPSEALRAVTAGAAAALGQGGHLGCVTLGAAADLLVVGADHEEALPYRFGRVAPHAVVSAGRVVVGPGLVPLGPPVTLSRARREA